VICSPHFPGYNIFINRFNATSISIKYCRETVKIFRCPRECTCWRRTMVKAGRIPLRFILMRRPVYLLTFFILGLYVSPVWASNAASPLGINLSAVTYYSSEQPFLDIFKTAFTNPIVNNVAPNVGWLTQRILSASANAWDTGEEQYLPVDSNGWPTSLKASGESGSQSFNAVGVLLLRGLPTYPSGTYVVLYQGQGTINFSFDATPVGSPSTSSPCSAFPAGTTRVILKVATPSSAGILVQIQATDPNKVGNYLRNIQVVYAPTSTASVCDPNEQALENGSIFNPTFISKIAPFHTLRFMDWMNTNPSPKYTWASRPLPSNAFWSGPYGVPMEIMVTLANQIGADAWFNMPTYANNTFVTNFATYVHQNLGPGQQVYLEYTNEAFLGYVAGIMQTLGAAMWPTKPVNFTLGENYYGMQSALNCQAWKTAWGSASGRVVCVMGNQTGNWGVAQIALNCTYWADGPCSTNYGISAIGETGYFGPSENVSSSWLSLPDGGMSNLCAAFTTGGLDPNAPNGYIALQLARLAADYTRLASQFGLAMVGYEGGPNLQSTDTAHDSLYTSFHNSPCMQTVYTAFLNQWKSTGYLQLMNQYNDATQPVVKYGLWGALDDIWETSSPTYDALTSFISSNPCWWAACSTTSNDAVPIPPPSVPTNLAGTAVSPTQINLSWTASTDKTAGVTGYNVFRNGSKVGTTASRSYQDTSLSEGATYTYSVSAYTATGATSAKSASISVTTPAPPKVVISSPPNGTVLESGNVSIVSSATNPTTNSAFKIMSIQIKADGKILQTCNNTNSCSTTWNGSSISLGTHVISATAIDASLLQTTASVTFLWKG
jgi:hypothetical protein